MYNAHDTLSFGMFEKTPQLISLKTPKTSGIISDLNVIRSVYETIPENEHATQVRKQLLEQFSEVADLHLTMSMYGTIGEGGTVSESAPVESEARTEVAPKQLVSKMTGLVKEMLSELSRSSSSRRLVVS